MHVAKETFSAEYEGETITFTAGVSHVSDDHEAVRRYPGKFRPYDGELHALAHGRSRENDGTPAVRMARARRRCDVVGAEQRAVDRAVVARYAERAAANLEREHIEASHTPLVSNGHGHGHGTGGHTTGGHATCACGCGLAVAQAGEFADTGCADRFERWLQRANRRHDAQQNSGRDPNYKPEGRGLRTYGPWAGWRP